MSLIPWRNNEIFNLRKEIDNFVSDVVKNFPEFGKAERFGHSGLWSPAIDFIEEEKNYLLMTDLPGLEKKDVKITLSNNVLSVSGERNIDDEIKEKNVHRIERSYGKFYRSIRLPDNILADKIDAEFKDGQLKIIIPKGESEKAQEIEIKAH